MTSPVVVPIAPPEPRRTIPIGAQAEPVSKLPPATGPVVWSAIIGVTVVLLFLFQKVLWLVVPFLLALLL